jgi:GT2 family glycosyltransferase
MPVDTLIPPKQNQPPKKPQVGNVPQDQPISVISPPGLASIVIPCCGQLEFTKLCVASLLRHTRKNHELIFLDIGSLDGTAEYLAGFAAAAQVRVEIVRSATDIGIPQAVQTALKQARGDYVVLLNNDTIVTNGWLVSLVGLADLSPAIGLVGPMTNYAAHPQLVEKVPYRIGPKKNPRLPGQGGSEWLVDFTDVDAFAAKWREDHKGKWMEADSLGGFCLLIKREALNRIGPLDKASELGVFDYPVISRKAREAGYTLACCRDLYIHHFGTRTFAHSAPKSGADTAKPPA